MRSESRGGGFRSVSAVADRRVASENRRTWVSEGDLTGIKGELGRRVMLMGIDNVITDGKGNAEC